MLADIRTGNLILVIHHRSKSIDISVYWSRKQKRTDSMARNDFEWRRKADEDISSRDTYVFQPGKM
jgi:hypothetical protein